MHIGLAGQSGHHVRLHAVLGSEQKVEHATVKILIRDTLVMVIRLLKNLVLLEMVNSYRGQLGQVVRLHVAKQLNQEQLDILVLSQKRLRLLRVIFLNVATRYHGQTGHHAR